MYITQETDYAIRIVYCLAKSGVRRDARSISEEMCVSLRFALKILGKLAQGGLVSSFKGNRGGYELARFFQPIPERMPFSYEVKNDTCNKEDSQQNKE